MDTDLVDAHRIQQGSERVGFTVNRPDVSAIEYSLSGKGSGSQWATRDLRQDRRLARLGSGARRGALQWAAHPLL